MSQPTQDNERRLNVIIEALDSYEEIQKKINHVDRLNSTVTDESLTSLIESVSQLSSILNDSILGGYRYQSVLEQSNELEHILSLPTRLNDLVQNNRRDDFQEAIDLMEQVDELKRNYGHQVAIIDTIHQQSELLRKNLISNLCFELENLKDLSHNEVISLVNSLIRCGNFSARDLRLKYLQARDNYFKSKCKKQGTSFDKLVSVYCNGLTTIFEEYRSIFSDSNELLDSNNLESHRTDSTKEDGAIINSWLLLKTSIFVSSLDTYLQTYNQTGTLTPTTIADTMKKCFELTNQLAKIGFDFSSQLRPLFIKTLANEVKKSIDKATANFEAAFAALILKSIESLLLPVDDEILRISNMNQDEQPPKSIEHYPIFKIYCLYIIDSLRWLQTTKDIVSPINLCLDTYAALNASLTRVTQALAVILNTDNNFNHPILSKIAISFLTEVLPYLSSYCEILFPEKVVLSTTGLSKMEFKNLCSSDPAKLKNFRLDLRQIAEPLRSTMPALMQTLEG